MWCDRAGRPTKNIVLRTFVTSAEHRVTKLKNLDEYLVPNELPC
jgi:hypothetical protein